MNRQTAAAVCISEQALSDLRNNLRGFIEKIGITGESRDFALRHAAVNVAVIPCDMINASHRGNEAEMIFSAFSLHELATANRQSGRSAKNTDVVIKATPLLMVRCPLLMLQNLFLKILS